MTISVEVNNSFPPVMYIAFHYAMGDVESFSEIYCNPFKRESITELSLLQAQEVFSRIEVSKLKILRTILNH